RLGGFVQRRLTPHAPHRRASSRRRISSAITTLRRAVSAQRPREAFTAAARGVALPRRRLRLVGDGHRTRESPFPGFEAIGGLARLPGGEPLHGEQREL